MTVGHIPCPNKRTKRLFVEGRNVISYEQPFKKLRMAFEADLSTQVHDSIERERMWFVKDPKAAGKSGRVNGWECLAKLNKSLDSFGLTRSKDQRFFHRNMTMAIIKKLFPDDLAENIDALREEFKTDVFKSEVLIVTPRRWGKTFSVAMFVAAAAVSIRGLEQAIFSTGRRASEKLLTLVYQFLCRLPGVKESIKKKNVETIWIEGPGGPDDIRKISSYPSKVSLHVLFYCCCSLLLLAIRACPNCILYQFLSGIGMCVCYTSRFDFLTRLAYMYTLQILQCSCCY